MEASTLRIGNIVERRWFLENNFRQITIDANDICTCVIRPEAFRPIPLTEEWLVKMGFEPIYYVFDELASYRINGVDFINRDMKMYWYGTQFEYVHQVQNAVSDIFRLELTIKP
jgi:hypothetical protein